MGSNATLYKIKVGCSHGLFSSSSDASYWSLKAVCIFFLSNNDWKECISPKTNLYHISVMPIAFMYWELNFPTKIFYHLGPHMSCYRFQDQSWYRFVFKRLQLQLQLQLQSFPSCLLDITGINLYSCQPTTEVLQLQNPWWILSACLLKGWKETEYFDISDETCRVLLATYKHLHVSCICFTSSYHAFCM